jgi:hypothetical protein
MAVQSKIDILRANNSGDGSRTREHLRDRVLSSAKGVATPFNPLILVFGGLTNSGDKATHLYCLARYSDEAEVTDFMGNTRYRY